MTAEQFAYWLQGFSEINEAKGHDNVGLTNTQWSTIRDHLALVFVKVTPIRAQQAPYTSLLAQLDLSDALARQSLCKADPSVRMTC